MSETENKGYISDELSDTTKGCVEDCERLTNSINDAIFSLEELLVVAGEVWELSDSAAWMDHYIYDKNTREKE